MKRILGKLHAWGNQHEWILILLLLVLILRLPTLFTPHYYGDEEIYFVMGKAWRDGVPMYQAMFDHKPPLIYVLAGVAQTVFWFRTMLLVTMLLHTWLFYRLSTLFFGSKKPILMGASTLLFVLLTSLPLLEGNIANAELFMMMPVTASLLILWKGRTDADDRHYGKYLLAGLVAGIGWLFKVPVVMDVLAIGLYLFVFSQKSLRASIRGIFSHPFILYMAGFVLPLLATFGYYYLKGNGPSYLETVLTINLGYVSSWSTSQFAFNPLKSGLVARGIVLAGFTLLLYLLRNRLPKRLTLATLWLGFSFFGSLLSGRPYPHYLQEPVVPFALLAPLLFTLNTVASWVIVGYLLLWGVMTNRQIKFWGYPTLPLYQNFGRYMTGKLSQQAYYETFDGARRNYLLAHYLNERMQPEDKLYLWGSDAALYNLTDKLPSGGKYIVNFHVQDFHKEDYVIANLMVNKPKYIVTFAQTPVFPQLFELLSNEYLEVYQAEGARVYMYTPLVSSPEL